MEFSSRAEPEPVLTPDLPLNMAVTHHLVGEENGLDTEHEDEEQEEDDDEEDDEEDVVGASGGVGAAGVRSWGGPGGLLRRRTEGCADGGGGGDGGAEPTPYRDIWSLRASLEQYASSDLSSNDRDSTRSDPDSLSSLGGAAAGKPGGGTGQAAAMMMFQSQDIDEELPYDEPLEVTELPEGEEEEDEQEDQRDRRRRGGRDSVDSERGGGSDGEAGSRKLLQMDSGYASMDAPPLAGGGGGGGGKTASERRRYFTSAGRKGTVCESFEARLLQEEPNEMETEVEIEVNHAEAGTVKLRLVTLPVTVATATTSAAVVIPKEPRPATIIKSPLAQKQRHFRRRDYSIDERTEALFNEFLRHDPHLDPRPHHHHHHHHGRSSRSSRLHLRAQWQRAKQHSDPTSSMPPDATSARLSPSLERLRWGPLKRGESAGYPLDAATPPPPPTATARYHLHHLHHHHHHHLHGPLPRIASAADEENSEGGEEAEEESQIAEGSMEEQEKEVVEEKGVPKLVVEEEKLEDNCSNNNSSGSSRSGYGVQNIIPTLHPGQGDKMGEKEEGLGIILSTGLEHSGTLEDPGSLATGKIAANLEERLYGGLRGTHHVQEQNVVVARTCPDDPTD